MQSKSFMLCVMSYGTQLRAAREALGLTQEQAAEKIGVSRVAYVDWEQENAAPTKKHWPNIEAALGVRLTLSAQQEQAAYGLEDQFCFIARLDVAVAAGAGKDNESESLQGMHPMPKHWVMANGLSVAALRVVKAVGDSMYPSINDGDIVIVNTGDRKLRSGQTFAFRTEDGCRFKRLYKQMDGRIRVVSDNPDKINYPDEWLTPGMEAEIIGVVVYRAGDT